MQECIDNPELRDETFLQIMKQLRDNPSSVSLDRGWVLLQLCLQTFPPSEDAENFVEYFLRTRSAKACVRALHRTLFRGPAPAPLDASAIDEALSHTGGAAGPSGAASTSGSATLALPSFSQVTASPIAPASRPGNGFPASSASNPALLSLRGDGGGMLPASPVVVPEKPSRDVRASVTSALLSAPPPPPSAGMPSAEGSSAEFERKTSNGESNTGASSVVKLKVGRPPGPPPPDARLRPQGV